MVVVTNTPVPELLLKQIELLSKQQDSPCYLKDPARISEFVTILQFLFTGLPLSTRSIAGTHNKYNKHWKQRTTSKTTIAIRIQSLVAAGLIKRIKDHVYRLDDNKNPTDVEAAHYALTYEGELLLERSRRGYSSVADFRKRLHPIYLHEYHPSYYRKTIPKAYPSNYHCEWLEKDPGNSEFQGFMQGLRHIENIEFHELKLHALATLDKAKKASTIRNHPACDFHLAYKPAKSGRLIVQPHITLGSSFLKRMRPAFDVNLQAGTIVYLDYSTQEIRLLAHYSQDPAMLDLVQNEPNLNKYFQQQIFGGVDKGLSKRYRSAWSYGSEGGGKLIEQTRDYLREHNIQASPIKFARHYFDILDQHFPRVYEYRETIASQWISDGFLIAPGGIRRDIGDDVRKKDGTPNQGKILRKGLSHITQGAGAWIARRIVAAAPHLHYAKLLIPVHDGFVFYLPNECLSDAYQEACTVMSVSTKGVVPFEMPFKLEWACNQLGSINVREFESTYRIDNRPIILPETGHYSAHFSELPIQPS